MGWSLIDAFSRLEERDETGLPSTSGIEADREPPPPVPDVLMTRIPVAASNLETRILIGCDGGLFTRA